MYTTNKSESQLILKYGLRLPRPGSGGPVGLEEGPDGPVVPLHPLEVDLGLLDDLVEGGLANAEVAALPLSELLKLKEKKTQL